MAKLAALQVPSAPRTVRKVPSGPVSRVVGFGGLAVGLVSGTIGELVRHPSRLWQGGGEGSGGAGEGRNNSWKSIVLNEANMDKLVNTLCRMRGAALKIGQMLSLQDDNVMPPEITHALNRVRQEAHIMPLDQLHGQLCSQVRGGALS
jgi:aarF domain-containing kinase